MGALTDPALGDKTVAQATYARDGGKGCFDRSVGIRQTIDRGSGNCAAEA